MKWIARSYNRLLVALRIRKSGKNEVLLGSSPAPARFNRDDFLAPAPSTSTDVTNALLIASWANHAHSSDQCRSDVAPDRVEVEHGSCGANSTGDWNGSASSSSYDSCSSSSNSSSDSGSSGSSD